MKYPLFLSILCLFLLFTHNVISTELPPLSLAKEYQSDIDISQYWISEKLDGIRAYWDGKQLLTRQGNLIHAPDWFTNQLPNEPLDGELWRGRGEFEKTVSTVLSHQADDQQWRHIRYMVFDLPASKHIFEQRLKHLKQLLKDKQSVVQLIPHWQVKSDQSLQQSLQSIMKNKGEGLMLHRANSRYQRGRNNDILKLKPFNDAEAIVLAYKKGKGKYLGQLGSLLVKDLSGNTFYIGSGFTDQQRQNPPAIGSVITFRYNGLTAKGVPRHARFLRIRTDHNF
jgi:DNA ligase-1